MSGRPLAPRLLRRGGVLLVVCLPLLGGRSLAGGAAEPSATAARPVRALGYLLPLDRVRPGDVVLAQGQTGASHAVEALSANPRAWTHAGIVSAELAAEPLLVHATPHFVNGPGSGVERVALRSFLADPNVLRAGLFRPPEPTPAVAAARLADRYVGAGVRFDQEFDFDTRADLYCTELVYRAYAEGAGVELIDGGLPVVRVLLKDLLIVLPDHLATGGRLRYLGNLK